MWKRILYSILTVPVFLFSCDTMDPDLQEYEADTGVFICNEGNFTFGNGSLSYFSPALNEVNQQVFVNANGFPLGDVVFSMMIQDSTGYIVINNSGKIVTMNTITFKHTGTLNGLTSPRYLHPVTRHKAYVTDLYSPSITIIDPQALTITGSVHVGSSTEAITGDEDFVYVTSWSFGRYVYKLSVSSDRVLDSLRLPYQPNSLCLDHLGQLWILCDGGYPGIPGGQDTAALVRINPRMWEIQQVFRFSGLQSSPRQLQLSRLKDTLYYLDRSWSGDPGKLSGIYVMAVSEEVLPADPLISAGNRQFYSMGLDTSSSVLYVTDAGNYLSRGRVYRYRTDGTVLDSFRADLVPGNIRFKYR